jgi:hypothetical protein
MIFGKDRKFRGSRSIETNYGIITDGIKSTHRSCNRNLHGLKSFASL